MRKLGFLLLITYLFTACHCAYAVPASEVKQWIEDIDSYRQQLEEKHINLYHSVSKKEFVSALSQLKTSLADLNEQQLLVEMMRISRLIGDGHTQLAFWETDIGFYPFRFLNINGNLRLIASSEAYRYLLGYKLSAIDDIPIDEVVTRLSPVVQGVENAHSLKVRIAWQINVAQILRGLSIIDKPDRARFTFIDDSGHQEIVSVIPASLPKLHKKLTHFLFPRKIPFSEQKITVSENLWMSADKDTKTAYIYFRRYPSFSDMEDFAKDVKDYLENNKIKNLVIDLRNNGGGDFFVGLRMAWPLVLVDSLDWEHGVYTLIGNSTYSAAMSNAAQYRQLLNAKLVGEPTGGNPVGYQDMGQFSLPNSGWTITYSKRNYRFQEFFSEGVQPDVLIEQDWPSYLKGIDQSLAWVLDDIRKKQIRNWRRLTGLAKNCLVNWRFLAGFCTQIKFVIGTATKSCVHRNLHLAPPRGLTHPLCVHGRICQQCNHAVARSHTSTVSFTTPATGHKQSGFIAFKIYLDGERSGCGPGCSADSQLSLVAVVKTIWLGYSAHTKFPTVKGF